LFLVRGLPGLKPGTVRSISRRREQVYPGQRIGPFIAGAELWELLAYGTAAPSRTPPSQAAEPAIRDYQLILWTRRGDRAQPIFQQAAVYSPPTVLWIGDLDGDGQADVLLDPATGGEEPVPLVLWASSLAGPTELAHKVAGYRTIYCD